LRFTEGLAIEALATEIQWLQAPHQGRDIRQTW